MHQSQANLFLATSVLSPISSLIIVFYPTFPHDSGVKVFYISLKHVIWPSHLPFFAKLVVLLVVVNKASTLITFSEETLDTQSQLRCLVTANHHHFTSFSQHFASPGRFPQMRADPHGWDYDALTANYTPSSWQ